MLAILFSMARVAYLIGDPLRQFTALRESNPDAQLTSICIEDGRGLATSKNATILNYLANCIAQTKGNIPSDEKSWGYYKIEFTINRSITYSTYGRIYDSGMCILSKIGPESKEEGLPNFWIAFIEPKPKGFDAWLQELPRATRAP